MSRRRRIGSLYLGIARTYWKWAASLLTLGVVVFVPIGLFEALAAEVDLESIDLGSGFKIAAAAAAISLITATSLLGEVFYSGAVAISLTHPEGEQPPSLPEIARRLNYWRLIAIDIVYVLLVIAGLVAFVVPGVLIFVWFGLSGPIVELEGRTVRGALARSWSLVRGNFWVVFFVLAPIEVVGDSVAEGMESLIHHTLGEALLASWVSESLSNILLTPFFAIAAVLLTLELATIRDGARPAAAAGSPVQPATRSR